MSAGSFWIVRPPKPKPRPRPRPVWVPRVVKKSQAGFTLLAMLLVVAATGAALAAIGEMASHAMQREKEAELLFVGNQYREAIASYYSRTPGAAKRYPAKLEDLLEDKRFPMTQRHLRRLYRDPITGEPFEPVPSPEGGVMGVRSRSEAEPIKTGNFLARDETFGDAKKYSDWQFVYTTTTTQAKPK